jgi:hypothetical protein
MRFTLLLTAVLVPSVTSAQVFKPPLVKPGDSVRVLLKDPGAIVADIRLMSSRPRQQIGRVTASDVAGLTLDIDGRIANVAGIGIGRMTTEHTVSYDQLERLEIYRGWKFRQPGPARIALSALVAGGVFALTQQGTATCGDKPCTVAQTRGYGGVAGIVVGGLVAFWPVSKWATVELPAP